ncbi:MAG TPA: septum formation initiator family protein [Spongiibacteraceae bacterium]|nr:septum formation initiator family protein [Spongiibacteraceae bacterium]
MLRGLTLILLVVLAGLQYRLWVGPGSYAEVKALEARIKRSEASNSRLQVRNHLLEQEVLDLKESTGSIEARARRDLGMVREGETFYLIAED